MNTPSNRPLNISIDKNKLTTSDYNVFYNFESLYNLKLQKITRDDIELGVDGIKVKQSITSHKCFKFESFEYNYIDLVLMRKHDEYSYVDNTSGTTTMQENANKYSYSFLIRTATDDFRQKLHIEIPIHNYDDISDNLVLKKNVLSSQNDLASEIIKKIYDNQSTLITNLETVDFNPKYNFDLNNFINETEFFVYNYSDGNSLYRYLFIEPQNSKIVVLKEYIDYIDQLLSYINVNNITQQLITSDNFVTFNKTQIKKTIDVTKENEKILPEIYIDCQPSDDANALSNTVSLFNKSTMSNTTKQTVDAFVTFIFNILIVFVVVYFLYYKLPKMINFSSITKSTSSAAATSSV